MTSKQKKQFEKDKKTHEAILRKYEIRVGPDLEVPTKKEIEGKREKMRSTLNAYLYDFTFPADFKTTFKFIDKYFPELIKKTESMHFRDNMTTHHRKDVMINTKHWWFGFLQARMAENM